MSLKPVRDVDFYLNGLLAILKDRDTHTLEREDFRAYLTTKSHLFPPETLSIFMSSVESILKGTINHAIGQYLKAGDEIGELDEYCEQIMDGNSSLTDYALSQLEVIEQLSHYMSTRCTSEALRDIMEKNG